MAKSPPQSRYKCPHCGNEGWYVPQQVNRIYNPPAYHYRPDGRACRKAQPKKADK